MAKFNERNINIKKAMDDYVERLIHLAIVNAPREFHEYALTMASLRDQNELNRAEDNDDMRAFQYYEALALLFSQGLVRAAAGQRHY